MATEVSCNIAVTVLWKSTRLFEGHAYAWADSLLNSTLYCARRPKDSSLLIRCNKLDKEKWTEGKEEEEAGRG